MNLTERAEQALLGALLTDPGLAVGLPRLEPRDFTAEIHRQAFESLSAIGSGQERRLMPLTLHDRDQLIRACPEPAHVGAYARMVLEASLRRELLAHAARLRLHAANLHYDTRRASHARRPGDALSDLLVTPLPQPAASNGSATIDAAAGHELQLAVTLHAHAAAFDPGADVGELQQAAPAGPSDIVPDLAPPARLPGPWNTAAVTTTDRAAQLREDREEQVLASLIQGLITVPGMLPARAFTGPRRELSAAINALNIRGEPVDELTVDWERARTRAGITVLPEDGPDPGQDTSYARRLAGRRIDPDTAQRSYDLLTRLAAKATRPSPDTKPPAARPSAQQTAAPDPRPRPTPAEGQPVTGPSPETRM